MNHIETDIEKAKKTCQKKGIKLTTKREIVFRVIMMANSPLSAYEIIELCREQHSLNITPMSIYRMLNYLEDNHLIHRLKSANKYIPCIHMHCGHEHKFPQFLICKTCGYVKEIDISKDMLEALRKNISLAGFEADEMQLELESLCQICKEKKGEYPKQ